MKSSSPLAKPLAVVLLVTTIITLSVSPAAFATMPDSSHIINPSPTETTNAIDLLNPGTYSSGWLNANLEDPVRRVLAANPYKNILVEKADKSFSYNLDDKNVPMAANADGISARYLDVTPNHLKIQVLREKQLTQLEFVRRSEKESILEISTPGQPSFLVTTKRDLTRPEEITLRLQFKNRRADLQIKNGELSLSKTEALRYEKLITELRSNKAVTRSMDAGRVAASEGVLSGAMSMLPAYAVFDSLDCIIAAGECILTIGTYVGSIASLIALCPETIGASCLAALLLHPVIAVLVAA